MFTGITRGTFPVTRVERKPTLLRFTVELSQALADGLELGASVSIDGVCQTVVERSGREAAFEAIQESLERTTLGELDVGSRVSVERSFRVGDEIGGHEVSGHIIGTGRISELKVHDDVWELAVEVPKHWMKYILPKGFIAVDGSSLTVGEVDAAGGRFWLHLIPETLAASHQLRRQDGRRPRQHRAGVEDRGDRRHGRAGAGRARGARSRLLGADGRRAR